MLWQVAGDHWPIGRRQDDAAEHAGGTSARLEAHGAVRLRHRQWRAHRPRRPPPGLCAAGGHFLLAAHCQVTRRVFQKSLHVDDKSSCTATQPASVQPHHLTMTNVLQPWYRMNRETLTMAAHLRLPKQMPNSKRVRCWHVGVARET